MVKLHLNTKKISTLIALAVILSITMLPHCEAALPTVAVIYIDPPRIVGTQDENINVTVMCKDFTGLYTWQAAVHWDPNILNCTAVYGGDAALPDNVFKLLAPSVFNAWIPGMINNIAGKLSYSAQSLSGENSVTGTAGVGYKLMKLAFKVKVSGVSDLHLNYAYVLPSAGGMPNNIIDVFTAWGQNQVVTILTNSTGEAKTDIHSHSFNNATKELSWNFTSILRRDWATTTIGFSNVTIPKTLMWVDDPTDWQILVKGVAPLSKTITEDTNNYYIYFTYNHEGTLASPKQLKVRIMSKFAVPEFPTSITLLLLMLFSLVTLALGRTLKSKKP